MYDPDFWTCDIEESFIRVVFGGRVAWRPAAYAIFDTFAAITSLGGVVTWGDPVRGGDSSQVQDQLYDIQLLGQQDPDFRDASGWPFCWPFFQREKREITQKNHGLIFVICSKTML